MSVNMIRLLLFTAAFCGTVVLTAEWAVVERLVNIPWDLEATPLQIWTDSTLVQYEIYKCVFPFRSLPVQPPSEVIKIWTITKTDTALIITCNGVEVLNYLFTDSTDSLCGPLAQPDSVEEIHFSGDHDQASDFYRAEPKCPAFTVEGSTQRNWADSPAGTTATIGCAATHILMGNATLTCQQDGSWSSDLPQCAGKFI
uniref:Putative secretory peptide-27 n=1 Tax=Pleurobrachia bachei TaxID=34499 RepID=M4H1D4_PLEBA|nr:putative secretory peptide-27 [Pleurobrachia bachei]